MEPNSNPTAGVPAPQVAGRRRSALIRDWVGLIGAILASTSFFAVLCLLTMDFFAKFSNPYMGVLTYLVAPVVLILGVLLILIGFWRVRRRRRRLGPEQVPPFPRFDLNVPHQRHVFVSFLGIAFGLLLLTAIGSYRAYHFTESEQFCGQACHTVMNPEFTAYQNSPHARVSCTQCHIGPGATWFVRSKLSGTYQVYAVMANKYPRPIPTPIKNLRPAQETCEQCHWPQKFYGSAERTNQHYLSDDANSPWTIRLLMKIGGGDPSHGPVGGIHWHMNIANKIEYIASDAGRQTIPWVRFTDSEGNTTVYRTTDNPLTPEQVAAAEPRRLDCMDCHNRPSHIYNTPWQAVNISMSVGRISPQIPSIKQQAVAALMGDYQTTDEARRKIAETLRAYYKTNQKEFMAKNAGMVERAIAEVQGIYAGNFFPEMKVNWRVYPNNIGHTMFKGCFRCHDGLHISANGKTISHDCNSCHIIIAQGRGKDLEQISPAGLPFVHPGWEPGDDSWKQTPCYECHIEALK